MLTSNAGMCNKHVQVGCLDASWMFGSPRMRWHRGIVALIEWPDGMFPDVVEVYRGIGNSNRGMKHHVMSMMRP